MNFITVDPATTTGVAYLQDNVIVSGEFTGTPVTQFNKIVEITELFKDAPMIVFEELNFFRNAKTVRSLSQRVGYLNWRFIESGFDTSFINTMKVRKYLDCKSKDDVYNLVFNISGDLSLTYNMTDAIAILLFVNKITADQIDKFTVKRF